MIMFCSVSSKCKNMKILFSKYKKYIIFFKKKILDKACLRSYLCVVKIYEFRREEVLNMNEE